MSADLQKQDLISAEEYELYPVGAVDRKRPNIFFHAVKFMSL